MLIMINCVRGEFAQVCDRTAILSTKYHNNPLQSSPTSVNGIPLNGVLVGPNYLQVLFSQLSVGYNMLSSCFWRYPSVSQNDGLPSLPVSK